MIREFFCCYPRTVWCLVDTVLHRFNIDWAWVCDRHDEAIMRSVPSCE